MEFSNLILSRESIRNYDPARQVPKETLLKIVDAAHLAPSAVNYQPWRFLIISSKEILQKLHKCYGREWFQDAPHVLIIVGDKSKSWIRSSDGYCSIETDLAIAMTHILLAAENEGVASCWISNFNLKLLREILDLGKDERVYSMTPLGYPKPGFHKKGIKERKELKDIIEWL
ncbi:MAG TPA: nitroreductase family protein [Ignavibacteriaceae bacterium]|nr:nitroreductase family protein [Ignavibacteriaceae bacterium]